MFLQTQSESITEVLTKATPALAVSGMTFFGVSLPDIVQLLTIVYIGFLIFEKGYLMYKKFKEKSNASS